MNILLLDQIYDLATYVHMDERIRSTCCNHYENKAVLSISNMDLLFYYRRSLLAIYIMPMKTSRLKRPKLNRLYSHTNAYINIHTHTYII